jgi:hypothetical protein
MNTGETSFSVVGEYRRFGGTHRLLLQARSEWAEDAVYSNLANFRATCLGDSTVPQPTPRLKKGTRLNDVIPIDQSSC